MGFSVLCIVRILFNPVISQKIASDTDVKMLCVLLWALLGLSFLFIFVDFTMYGQQKKDLAALAEAAKSDPLSRLANRFSVDTNIEQYDKHGVPAHFACVMFGLANIQSINQRYGREAGNRIIQDFSMIMSLASRNLCFVGKNGGNRYLALFEEGSEENVNLFLDRLYKKLLEYNSDPNNHILKYSYGEASRMADGDLNIHELIALADQRVTKEI